MVKAPHTFLALLLILGECSSFRGTIPFSARQGKAQWRVRDWTGSSSELSARSLSLTALQVMRPAADLSEVELNYGLSTEVPPETSTWFQDRGISADGELVVSTAVSMGGVLAQLWGCIAPRDPAKAASLPRQTAIFFPECSPLAESGMIARLIDHLETCKDVCDHFGSKIMAFPLDPRAPSHHPAHAPVVGVLLRRFGASTGFPLSSGTGPAELPPEDSLIPDDWGADPYWDDNWDEDPLLQRMINDARAAGEKEDGEANDLSGLTAAEIESLHNVPNDDATLVQVSRQWVAAMIADMGVCPFTTSSEKAGLPLGEVHYPVSRVVSGEEMYRDYWHEVALVESAPARSLSTTLLITPHFGLTNLEAFMAFTDTLNNPLEPLGLETSVQLVFFHPQWVFRDGRERQGTDSAGNFARRSPFPMINILRTPQVRIAQRAIPTGQVYQQNEETLDRIGAAPLQRMLLERDWGTLKEHKIDRRANELYDTAQRLVEQYASGQLQALGQIQPTAEVPPAETTSDAIESMDIVAMLEAIEELEGKRRSHRQAQKQLAN